MEVKKIQDHLEKDDREGGYMLFMAAYKGDEQVSKYGVGQDYSTFCEEDIKNAIIGYEKHLELNKRKYDRIVVGADLKQIEFESEWNELTEDERWMIRVAIPEVFDNPYLKITNTVKSLVRVANKRIRQAGFYEICSRCGGSGHYSRNAKGDTTCYKCKGAKTTLPRLTNKVKNEIEKELLKDRKCKGGVIYWSPEFDSWGLYLRDEDGNQIKEAEWSAHKKDLTDQIPKFKSEGYLKWEVGKRK